MKKNPYAWIVEVLDDLNQFSVENKLHRLSLAIEEAKVEALLEFRKSNCTNYETVMNVVFPNGSQHTRN